MTERSESKTLPALSEAPCSASTLATIYGYETKYGHADKVDEITGSILSRHYTGIQTSEIHAKTVVDGKRHSINICGLRGNWAPEVGDTVKITVELIKPNAKGEAQPPAKKTMNKPKDSTGGCCPPPTCSPCECQNWCREGQKIITKHHPRCSKYSLEDDAKELITDLLRGIEAWSSDEDGVHPECWEAYKRAKAAVWEMHDVHGEGF